MVELALIILLVTLVAWVFLNQNGILKHEANAALKSTVVEAVDGVTRFDGAVAHVLLKDFIPMGGGDTLPQLSAKYLCKMPSGGVYWVLVETPSESGESTSVQVSELSDVDIRALIDAYPYLRKLREQLTQSV